ncbi:MAG: hypothetical protein IKZ88_10110 [Neisseriaceae bacterium]|nr:hypothetical protein [Neisseriaceae bacterium]
MLLIIFRQPEKFSFIILRRPIGRFGGQGCPPYGVSVNQSFRLPENILFVTVGWKPTLRF